MWQDISSARLVGRQLKDSAGLCLGTRFVPVEFRALWWFSVLRLNTPAQVIVANVSPSQLCLSETLSTCLRPDLDNLCNTSAPA